MEYDRVIDYLYTALPAYQREGGKAIKKNLGNIEQLLEAMGNPHLRFKSVHIAGTNGKGSVSHLMASVLQEAGYRVGLYTSPHLTDFRERVRINGEPISKARVIDFVDTHRDLFTQVRPSFFEMTVALAFLTFAEEKVDISVVETGVGGRLDSTNVLTPLISVITNVDFDHMEYLGDTLEAIAREKAGIIKQSIPTVLGRDDASYRHVFERRCRDQRSDLTLASEVLVGKIIQASAIHLHVALESSLDGIPSNVEVPSGGLYQLENVITALVALWELRERGHVELSTVEIVKGIARMQEHTGLQGRWQVVSKDPYIILDGGHNPAGFAAVMVSLNNFDFDQLHIVLGASKGKDLDPLFKLLPTDAQLHLCKADLPRAMEVDALCSFADAYSLKYTSHASVSLAIAAAQANAKAEDLIFVGGSLYVVAEAIAYFQR